MIGIRQRSLDKTVPEKALGFRALFPLYPHSRIHESARDSGSSAPRLRLSFGIRNIFSKFIPRARMKRTWTFHRAAGNSSRFYPPARMRKRQTVCSGSSTGETKSVPRKLSDFVIITPGCDHAQSVFAVSWSAPYPLDARESSLQSPNGIQHRGLTSECCARQTHTQEARQACMCRAIFIIRMA